MTIFSYTVFKHYPEKNNNNNEKEVKTRIFRTITVPITFLGQYL